MWYFMWIVEVFLACAFGIITSLILEYIEMTKTDKEVSIKEQNKDY